VRLVTTRYDELPTEQRELLEQIANVEFGQVALVRETRWAEPEWSFQLFDGESLAAFYNVVLRAVRFDGVSVRAAGLNTMITVAAHRGQGVASRLLLETQPRWFDTLGAECGVLLCADALVPFYARLGWRRTDARVLYEQPAGSRTWESNCMLLDPRGAFEASHDVDLCGLPW
jgi:GNAT superfamily N-acetyltransferase